MLGANDMTEILVFTGRTTTGTGFWTTDGTVAGTTQLTVGNGRPLNLGPYGLTPVNGRFVFAGTTDDPSHYGLWETDGTATGTMQLTGSRNVYIDPSTYYSGGVLFDPVGRIPQFVTSPTGFTRIGSSVLYADAPIGGQSGLWITDGTLGGTSQLVFAGSNPSGSFSNPDGFQSGSLGNKVIFGGQDASGQYSVWVTDGSGAGTTELTTHFGNASFFSGPGPRNFTPVAGKSVFTAPDARGGQSVWATDGTSPGTVELLPGSQARFVTPSQFVPIGGRLAFDGTSSTGRTSLWVTDGTVSGTVAITVAGESTAASGLSPSDLTVFGSNIAFAGYDAHGQSELWVSDGTAAGTSEIAVAGAYASGVFASDITAFGNKLLFNGINASGQHGLWVSDGTAAGTIELFAAGAADQGLDPKSLFVFGGKAYFNGYAYHDAPAAAVHLTSSLWVTDGTAAGTVRLDDQHTQDYLQGRDPRGFTAVDIATPTIAYTDTSAGTSSVAVTSLYTGPVSYLNNQYVWTGPGGVAIAAHSANVFLHGGTADDALTAVAGSNVLDGGQGSNFLTGATGADGGTDTFYVDGRSGGTTWSTINNFHHGDVITLWGFTAGSSTGFDTASGKAAFVTDGVTGYQGATIHSELGGAGTGVNASLTIAGLSVADAASKLSVSTGTIGAEHFLYIAYTG